MNLRTLIPAILLATAPLSFIEAAPDMCSQAMLFSYFPESFVEQTLKKFAIPQEKWKQIEADLAEKDSQIVKIVEEKAAKKDPTLVHDFKRRHEMAALFQQTFLEIFTEVMTKNGITDTTQIEAMLKDIQKQKVEQFKGCLKKLDE